MVKNIKYITVVQILVTFLFVTGSLAGEIKKINFTKETAELKRLLGPSWSVKTIDNKIFLRSNFKVYYAYFYDAHKVNIIKPDPSVKLKTIKNLYQPVNYEMVIMIKEKLSSKEFNRRFKLKLENLIEFNTLIAAGKNDKNIHSKHMKIDHDIKIPHYKYNNLFSIYLESNSPSKAFGWLHPYRANIEIARMNEIIRLKYGSILYRQMLEN